MSMFLRMAIDHWDSPLLSIIRSCGILDIDEGPWVAGGAALCVVQDRIAAERPQNVIPPPIRGGKQWACSDIDVFVKRSQDVVPISIHISKNTMVERARFSTTFGYFTNTSIPLHGNQYKAQVIHKTGCDTVESVLSSFDFTVSKFATDGKTLVGHISAIDDLRAGALRISDGGNKRTLWRLAKYCRKGFVPSPGMIRKAIEGSMQDVEFNSGIFCKPGGDY